MIIGVAIRLNDVIYQLPQPARHNDVRRLITEAGEDPWSNICRDGEGFIDDEHGFVRRKPAFRIAYKAGQLIDNKNGDKGSELLSDYVW